MPVKNQGSFLGNEALRTQNRLSYHQKVWYSWWLVWYSWWSWWLNSCIFLGCVHIYRPYKWWDKQPTAPTFWKPPICRGHQMSEGTMEVQLLLASRNPQRWIFHAAGIWEVNLSYGCILCQSNDPPGLQCSGRTPRPFDSQNQEYFLHQSKLRKTSESPTAKNITGITGRRTHGK